MNTTSAGQRNYYDELELSQSASPEVIRAAYKSLIQRYHPDRNHDDKDAAERSARVVRAYQVLSDPVERAGYDFELKQMAEIGRRAVRRRGPLDSMSSGGNEKRIRWGIWVPAILLALLLLYFWTTDLDPIPDTQAPGSVASPRDSSQQKTGDAMVRSGSRSVPDFIQDMKVPLNARRGFGAEGGHGAAHVLSIRTIGVVAGGFDTDRYVDLLHTSRDYIARQLSARLANAEYDKLVDRDGDRYLQKLILDLMREITNTAPLVSDGASRGGAAIHYGAVEILLPDLFSVESRQAGQVTNYLASPR